LTPPPPNIDLGTPVCPTGAATLGTWQMPHQFIKLKNLPAIAVKRLILAVVFTQLRRNE